MALIVYNLKVIHRYSPRPRLSPPTKHRLRLPLDLRCRRSISSLHARSSTIDCLSFEHLSNWVLTTVVLHVLGDVLDRRITITEVIHMTIGQIGSEIPPAVIIEIFFNPDDKVPRVRRRNFGPLYRRRSRVRRGRRDLDLLGLGRDVIVDNDRRLLGRVRRWCRRGSRKFGRCGCIDEVT
jgi:hypothetical protein